MQGNPAVDRSFANVVVTPHDYFGQRAAVFQWNGGADSYQGNAIAVCDKVFAAFDKSANVGNLTGGYMARAWGAGARIAFNRMSISTSDSLDNPNTLENDSTFAPSGYGVFGSMALQNKMTAYARLDWTTPSNYGHVKSDTYVGTNRTTTEFSSRADGIHLGGGVRSEAKGPRGYSWNFGLDYANYSYRASGQPSDSTHPVHTFHQLGQIGKTVEADGFVLAMGLDEKFTYANGRGGAYDTSFATGNVANIYFYQAPDWRYWLTLEPNLAVIVPLFENWTVKGGARTGITYTSVDPYPGEKEMNVSILTTASPTGSLGLRYSRGGRWAAETQVSNQFLTNGPYFISGGAGTAGLLTSFALTVSLK